MNAGVTQENNGCVNGAGCALVAYKGHVCFAFAVSVIPLRLWVSRFDSPQEDRPTGRAILSISARANLAGK